LLSAILCRELHQINIRLRLLPGIAATDREATIVIGQPPAGWVSDIRLLGHFERIVDIDARVPNGILQLGVPQQQLHRPPMARS